MDKIATVIKKPVDLLKNHVVIIVVIIFAAMYGYLIFTSSKLVEEQPGEAAITEKFQGASRPKIDESIARKLESLEDQNIEVKTLFEQARNNPFSE